MGDQRYELLFDAVRNHSLAACKRVLPPWITHHGWSTEGHIRDRYHGRLSKESAVFALTYVVNFRGTILESN